MFRWLRSLFRKKVLVKPDPLIAAKELMDAELLIAEHDYENDRATYAEYLERWTTARERYRRAGGVLVFQHPPDEKPGMKFVEWLAIPSRKRVADDRTR